MNAQQVLDSAHDRGWTIAAAESLTGGRVTARLVEAPGASAVVRGGVIAYATDLKARLLGVDQELLAQRGAVDPDVARAMAAGVRAATGADVGIATTGAAGPEPLDGAPPGTFHVAVVTPDGSAVRSIHHPGDRESVSAAAVVEALDLALIMLTV